MRAIQRLIRHLWAGQAEAKRVFPAAVQKQIETAVAQSEAAHRGELRVVIEGGLGWAGLRGVDVRQRAISLFASLGVWDTEDNAGVLLYILMAEHRLEILADRGVNALVPQERWNGIAATATSAFAQGHYAEGLMAAIAAISEVLSEHFPAAASNPNELADRPTML